MVKKISAGLLISAFAFMVTMYSMALAQTATPTMTPTPATDNVLPTAAPQTGHAE